MIPIAVILAALQAALEGLRAWNAMKPEHRDAIVQRWLDDDEKRRAGWLRFTQWFSGLIGQIKF